jgi:hypothetical protein
LLKQLGDIMEKYSIETLKNASQKLYTLSDKVQRYSDLNARLTYLREEEKKLNDKMDKNPYRSSFLWGFIGLGIGVFIVPVIATFTSFVVMGLFDKVDKSLGDLAFAYGFLMIPFRIIIYGVIGYFFVVLISYIIMRVTNHKETYYDDLKEKLSVNASEQLRISNEMTNLLTELRSKNSVLPYIPQPYQYPIAIRKFGDYFFQGRAKNIQEAANLFEEEKRYLEQQRQLQQINDNIVALEVSSAFDDMVDAIFLASLM